MSSLVGIGPSDRSAGVAASTGLNHREGHSPVERVSYLGYPMLVTERDVHVLRPDGRPLGVERSMSSARRLVRGYRKASRA